MSGSVLSQAQGNAAPALEPAPDPGLNVGKPKKGVGKKILFGIGAVVLVAFMMLDDPKLVGQKKADGEKVEKAMDPSGLITGLKDDAKSAPGPAKEEKTATTVAAAPVVVAKPVDEKAEEELRKREEEVRGSPISGNSSLQLVAGGATIAGPGGAGPAATALDGTALGGTSLGGPGVQRTGAIGNSLDTEIANLQRKQGTELTSEEQIRLATQGALQTAQAIQAGARPQTPTLADRNQNWLNGVSGEQNQVVRVQHAESPYTVHQGTTIRATLLTAINSMIPGAIRAQVTSDVYDTIAGNSLLIPKGSVLIGRYNSDTAYGQTRILFAFTRLIRPDGSWISLASSNGADSDGSSGVPGDSTESFLRTFGTALLVSAAAAFLPNSQQSISVTAGNGLSQAGGTVLGSGLNAIVQQLVQRNQSIQYALTREQGYEFFVIAARDMIFEEGYRVNH